MMKKPSKIVIVGAGPVGCYLGQLLKQQGFDPLILEEHSEVGKPVQCAGIVGRGLFEDLRIPLSHASIQNVIDGSIISYRDKSFELHRPKVAYIVDRERFDKELSHKLNIEYNTRLNEVKRIKDGYLLETSNGEYFTEIVVGADGPNSRVRKSLAFHSEMRLYRGYQYRVKMPLAAQNQVVTDYNVPFSLFNWVIPEGENGLVRIGSISNNPYQDLNNFVERQGYKFELVEKNAGAIPIGTCQLVKEWGALVGDAACQIKPITSGGIYYGLKSAELLADAIKAGNLSQYEVRWGEEFGQEIKTCLLIRNVLENMDEKVLAKVFDYVRDNSKVIEKMGDFENHSSVVWGLISNPRTYSTVGTVMMGMLKNPRFLMQSLLKFPK
ncbi:hypothetical protein A3K48_00875 [candidate division WOR-1 bacterium RIFOXYA12_FULL_52_29]|uniref:FAD-binding domain-containing protein n=1 Tax=candidate division WOR-1 bacterium RIFOXYC12_FULL_54_18 TaxID=1802584 RepID=A0A1F4T491_UNCSA|nr:MAG: hypothetical protein A3K44_00875 [candidate division WOR-1 bacterium RIFOXYA2_FULL_51_19]OGC17145.1 MAG: hypothetical protein A3K48_00875 [candidate division WOR-1 bacterium RIFOXYA12_FULL_52_29]OGC26005.1 MAG: hypothetical protein A3K32_00870 [candidate division WOR-1 bacterium RIFOXYB2_FULL_45_9]OGC27562.1 MAG: hypothetical protein A3K49_00875 [candidate division WOR-1 bacterium RIFOXYC12_FULL_54_18]OGC29225.1 MAG: hypothetical protein A2346_00835 [candidate division WOR-1 bacterium R